MSIPYSTKGKEQQRKNRSADNGCLKALALPRTAYHGLALIVDFPLSFFDRAPQQFPAPFAFTNAYLPLISTIPAKSLFCLLALHR